MCTVSYLQEINSIYLFTGEGSFFEKISPSKHLFPQFSLLVPVNYSSRPNSSNVYTSAFRVVGRGKILFIHQSLLSPQYKF